MAPPITMRHFFHPGRHLSPRALFSRQCFFHLSDALRESVLAVGRVPAT
jgi:hypothetical protein